MVCWLAKERGSQDFLEPSAVLKFAFKMEKCLRYYLPADFSYDEANLVLTYVNVTLSTGSAVSQVLYYMMSSPMLTEASTTISAMHLRTEACRNNAVDGRNRLQNV